MVKLNVLAALRLLSQVGAMQAIQVEKLDARNVHGAEREPPEPDAAQNDEGLPTDKMASMAVDSELGAELVMEEGGPELVYGHVPKGGGTFVKDVLEKLFPNGGVHIFDEKFPVTSEALKDFTIGSIRNPCEYYVSYWAFFCDHYQSLLPRGSESCGQKTDTRGDSVNIMKFREWLREGHQPNNVSAEDWVPSEWPGMLSVRIAFKYSGKEVRDTYPQPLTHLPREDMIAVKQAMKTFDTSSVDCWVHTESAVPDMTKCFKKYESVGGTVNWALFEELQNHTTHNPSHHSPCQTYFDKDSEAFVRAIDEDIFKKFEYKTCCT